MPVLLHLGSSPAGADSQSIQLAHRFLDTWAAAGPGREVRHCNLWETDLPDLGHHVLAARAAVESGRRPQGDAAALWERLDALAQPLLAADRLLISAPMWNFGIPYRLKHYIDCVTQPTLTYRGSPEEGFEGLIPGRPAALILTRGGSYPAGSERDAMDFQRRYLTAWLRFLGYRPVEMILAEPTTGDRVPVARAEQAARDLAARF